MWGCIEFSQPIIIWFLIFTYWNHPKLNLKFNLFEMNFYIIHLFQFLVLVEAMKSNEECTIYPHAHIYKANNHLT
jgi:hypothetical protein